ncbi:MAG: phosphoribosylaminoimidazolesuccinocarboxamide synthase [Candidatus Thermoplasmatota archaeon]|nr:phosphoribosylaminoimidazolesuccinocarboxamide synthase [Candidatus Thermoplasmatota archaeon]
MRLYKKGKVKEVYEVNNTTFLYRFTDNISVFDKIIPTPIPKKGESLCRTSAHWFGVAKQMGIHSDFKSLTGPKEMEVQRVDIIEDYSKMNNETTNYLIPLEVIARHYLAGSMHDRIRKGKIDPKKLGFSSANVEYGAKFPEPLLEFTTKLEPVDRPITEAEAMEISGLTKDEVELIKETTLKLDERMAADVKTRGLLHVDGKKEYAFDGERRLMLIDTFGTADEDRWWDIEAYENGKFVELSKEFVRQYYRKTGYFDMLEKAREEGKREPDIPPLPDKVVEEVTNLYVEMYQKLTGMPF